MYKGKDPKLIKLYNRLKALQIPRSFTILDWDKTKLTNLKTWLDNTGSNVSDYLKLKSDKQNKINTGEVSGIKQTKDYYKAFEAQTTKDFRKWLGSQNPETLKSDSINDLIRQSKIKVDRNAVVKIVEEPEFKKFTNIKRRWEDMPNLYDKKFVKHRTDIGSGVYEETSKKGIKNYYGQITRNKKQIKGGRGKNPAGAIAWLKEARKLPKAKSVIDLQAERGLLLEQPKYTKALADALDDLAKMEEKGYGAIRELTKKYQDKFSRVGEKTLQGKLIKTGVNTESVAITNAIRSYAAKNNIRDVQIKKMEEALDEYLTKKTVKRGDIPKLMRKHGIPEVTFNSWLIELDARRKIPLKYTSLEEGKKAAKIKRAAAQKEYSSAAFERWTKGSVESGLHGGHTGQIYSEAVGPRTKKFTPKWINQETLKAYDAILQAIADKRDAAFKAKNWAEVERLNQSGMRFAEATEGYKTFTIKNRDGTKFEWGSTTKGVVDPMSLTREGITAQEMESWRMGKNPVMRKARFELEKIKDAYGKNSIEYKTALSRVEELNAAEAQKLFAEGTNKALLDFQKEGAMKSAQLSQSKIIATDKRLLSRLAELQEAYKNAGKAQKTTIQILFKCRPKTLAAASGGRIGFAEGTLDACVNTKLKNQTLESSQKIVAGIEEGATGVLGKMRNAARGFLGALGRFGPKVGKYGAIAAAGALAQPLVKQFMNDDPSTYLTDPDQQAGLLDALIEGERPKPRSEILDWSHTAGTLGATAAAVPGTVSMYKARRGLLERKIPKAGPITEAGLTAGDYLKRSGKGYGKIRAGAGVGMKLVSGMFTPAGLLATEPLRIAQKRREGESWGEIGTDPTMWMGPAFAPGMTRMATRGMNPASLLPKLLRLGMSRAALAAMGPIGWVGLAASLGWEGRKQYQDYKKGRGFFAED